MIVVVGRLAGYFLTLHLWEKIENRYRYGRYEGERPYDVAPRIGHQKRTLKGPTIFNHLDHRGVSKKEPLV